MQSNTAGRVTARHVEPEADAFRRWEAEAFAAERAAQSLQDEPAAAPWWARQADLETLIIATPATTRAAVLVKARLGRIDRERDVDGAGVALWTAVIDHLAEGDEGERQTRFVHAGT